MRSNRVLKVMAYMLIPILIIIIVTSFFYESGKEYFDETEYFNSYTFANDYISNLMSMRSSLIYDYNYYAEKESENVRILYTNDDLLKIKNSYFLIIYKDKAITNVSTQYDTIGKIKDFINEVEKTCKVEIIDGIANTNSDILNQIGIDKYKGELAYYNTDNSGLITYYSAQLEDMEIYSSYSEEFAEDSDKYRLKKIADLIEPITQITYITLPLSSMLLIVLITYLIISIGYKKGVEGIDLNDFDKIPIEIVFCSAIIITLIAFTAFMLIANINEYITDLVVSTGITVYFIIYYVMAITINTIIKRIKSKTLVDTCWIMRIFRNIFNGIGKILNNLTYSTSITAKVIFYIGLIFIISAFIFLLFYSTGLSIILCLGFIAYIGYRLLRECVCMDKIEKKLKEMYEGNNSTKLNEDEFTNTLKKQVKYINDISNGFGNAIEEKMKSERLKTELITNVSHDIKTPLTSIINYVDLLKQEDIQQEKAKEYIGILDKKSQRLKKLIEDLVEASKVLTGNVKLNLESIDICELIKQTTGEFEDRFKQKGLDVITNIPNEGIYIKADNRYMYRIIENLFSNISKYALENSRVYLEIHNKINEVKIEMKNISKEKLNISADELMQRFVRGDKSRNTEGSGLGISISKSLTEIQNGKFNMEIDGDLFKVELEFTKIK